MIKRVPQLQVDDRTLGTIQSNICSTVDQISSNPITDGIILQNVALVTGSNIVSHKLGRKLLGWIPVRLRANATIFDTQNDNTLPALTLLLTASADVTVDLFVF